MPDGTLPDMKEENDQEQDQDQDQAVDSPAHAEAMQLMELIRFLARTLGFNNAKLSRRAKVPLATLVRYFKGEGEPKLEFLLSMVRTLGLDIREFFELAYPAPAAPTDARKKLDRILRQIQPTRLEIPPPPKPEPASLSRADVEKMMEDLRRDMREIVTTRAEPAPAAAPKSAAPARRRKKSDEG
jgi:AcrR family transcriptional regulator